MGPEEQKGTDGRPGGGPDLQAEIVKYTEMLAQDPQSRVFALLAEALRKSGDLDEAIRVAEEGLKTHAHYLSGRMALARAYYDKGQHDKAREEFERVISAAPDNLLAHKHLAEICLAQGEKAGAAKSLKMVVLLNPGDQEARARLASIAPDSQGQTDAPASLDFVLETHRYQEPVTEETAPEEVVPPQGFETHQGGETPGEEPGQPETAGVEEGWGRPEGFESPGGAPEEAPPEEEFSFEGLEEPETAGVEEALERPVGFKSPGGAPEVTAPPEGFEAFQGGKTPGEEPGQPETAGVEEALERPEGFETLGRASEEAPGEETPVERLEVFTDQEMLQEPEMIEMEEAPVSEPEETGGWEAVMQELTAADDTPDELDTQTLADLYIQQGFYDKALDIYGKILQRRPDDTSVRQKLEELESLARLREGRLAEEEPGEPARDEAHEAATEVPPQGGERESHALETLRQWLDRIKKERR